MDVATLAELRLTGGTPEQRILPGSYPVITSLAVDNMFPLHRGHGIVCRVKPTDFIKGRVWVGMELHSYGAHKKQ